MNFSSHDGEIPIPISSSYNLGGGAHCQSQSNCIGPPPPPHPETLPPLSIPTQENSKKGLAVKYRECLKNHAASIGGNATDGCGEFMPSGKEGTLEALKCSACNCHRNFHRKETEGISSSSCDCFHFKGGGKMYDGYIARPSPHQMIMPLGAMQTSESDDMEGYMTKTPMVKKRFRTKFSADQKEKMLGFAEKVGWRLQKQEDGLVQQFCQEIGIKRRVLKVWMHNNKHNLAKKSRNLQLDWSTSTTTVTDL